MLNRVFTRVDFPSPDSPSENISISVNVTAWEFARTDYHDIEVEALAHTLAVPLVGQIGETNVSSEFSADNVHVVGGLSGHLGVFVGDGGRSCGVSVSHATQVFVER